MGVVLVYVEYIYLRRGERHFARSATLALEWWKRRATRAWLWTLWLGELLNAVTVVMSWLRSASSMSGLKSETLHNKVKKLPLWKESRKARKAERTFHVQDFIHWRAPIYGAHIYQYKHEGAYKTPPSSCSEPSNAMLNSNNGSRSIIRPCYLLHASERKPPANQNPR